MPALFRMSDNRPRRSGAPRPVFIRIIAPVELMALGSTTLLPHAVQLNRRKSEGSSAWGNAAAPVVVMTDNGRRSLNEGRGTWDVGRGTPDAGRRTPDA